MAGAGEVREILKKLLSTAENALKDRKIAATANIDPTYKPVIEDAIRDANEFLNQNPHAKNDDKVKAVLENFKIVCQPLISALENNNHINGVSSGSSTSTPPKVIKKAHISHSSSEHEFKLVDLESSKPFKCEGCKQDVGGKAYKCSSCSSSSSALYYHHQCLEAKSEARSDLFPDGPAFELHAQPPQRFFACACDACVRRLGCTICGRRINKGLAYYRFGQNNKAAVHPLCFNLKEIISDHENGISFYLRDNMAEKPCFCCGRKKVKSSSSSSTRGWSYVSKDGENHIHVSCAMEMISRVLGERDK